MNLALLQIANVPNFNYLEQYLKTCQKQQVSLLCFPEYVFEPFFTSLKTLSSATLLSRANFKNLQMLGSLSAQYNINFLTPILVNNEVLLQHRVWGKLSNTKGLYKTIALIRGTDKIEFYLPQCLIGFEHWNERAFFDNKKARSARLPLTFEQDALKIGVLSGFELHFDEIFIRIKKEAYDMLIIPCANTFDTHARWRSLCKMRAFLNSCALLRINRVGNELVDGSTWNFYGDSLYINAYGKIEDSLQEYEGLMIVHVSKSEITQARESWGFYKEF